MYNGAGKDLDLVSEGQMPLLSVMLTMLFLW